jgi:LuxR family maltose regulon positive regulatory protein
MAWKTPLVEAGFLREPGVDTPIALDCPAWFAWLADDRHRCFHFAHASGGFTARKERKQRGQWYWVAYRQVCHKLHKTYLGKTETLTEARLSAASQYLAKEVKNAS